MWIFDLLRVVWGLLVANLMVWAWGLFGVEGWWPDPVAVLLWNGFLWIVVEMVWLGEREKARREAWRRWRRRNVSRETHS